MDRFCFNEEFKENLPRTGKLNGILKSIPIPEAFKKSYPLPSTIKISECLRILRPIFHCILLSVTAPNSFKPITVSLLMDLAILLLRIGYKKQTQAEVQEMKKRNKDLLLDYLLRKPIFTLLVQPYILEPLVKKVVPIEWVSSMIISTLLWRSSYCMNL